MHPLLPYGYLAAIAIEVLLPFLLGLWLARRLRAPWKFFWYGVLVFPLVQVPRVLGINFLQSQLAATLQASPLYLLAWIFFLALSAGLFEEGGRYLGYRFLWRDEPKTWPRALMYGAGHGGIESVLVGALVIVTLFGILALQQLDPGTLPTEQADYVLQAQATLKEVPWWIPLLGALERLLAAPVQISLSVLVLQVFVREKPGWWWLALGYHTLVDLVSSLAMYCLLQHFAQTLAAVLTEIIVLPFALLSIGFVLWLRPKGTPGRWEISSTPSPAGGHRG